MTRNEALVFTTYDSHPQDHETFCPTLHTAVPLPNSEGLQGREHPALATRRRRVK